jgi:hypothetical protein
VIRPTASAIAAVFLLSAVLTACGGSGANGGDKDGTMSTDSSVSPEAKLRGKPPFEVAQEQYGAEVRTMADGIAALVPDMTWNMKENTWAGCGGEFVNTPGVQVYLFAAFNRPIPEDKWPQALMIVEDGAVRLGAKDFGAFKDQAGEHDIYISGPDGTQFRFGTAEASSLTALSDCRLREADSNTPSHP